MRTYSTGLVAILGIALLAGCAGSGDRDDGLARQPSDFEELRVRASDLGSGFLRKGRFSTPGDIARISPGDSREDVQRRLGEPLSDSSDDWWFYNVNLPLEDMDDYLVCQLRVAFDRERKVSNVEWRRTQCRDRYASLLPPEPQQITLSSDVSFAFDSAELTDAGKRELDTAAAVVSNHIELTGVSIVGHTDRIGLADYNLDLSRQRAAAVGNYLVSRGVPGELVTTEGRGAQEPLVICEGDRVTESLKSCLQSNRRVHITIHGLR